MYEGAGRLLVMLCGSPSQAAADITHTNKEWAKTLSRSVQAGAATSGRT